MNNPLPFKAWYAGMLFCTVSLGALGVISKDNSVNSYVVLGIMVMFVAPVESMIKAVKGLRELKEYEERKRQAAARRVQQQSEEERREQERQKMMAANELAKRQAAKGGGTND